MQILLLGPTAVGKTALSIELAQALDAEIISTDSRQCYKYMNIGTATPTEKEQSGIPHYNLSIIDPATKDSVVHFYERAMEWKNDIQSRGKNVLYVGGSTLHVQCVIQPLDDVPESNEKNIAKLEKQIENEGIKKLYQKLQEVDPDYAQNMDGMNTQRIVRALDVWMQTGHPFSSFHSDNDTISVPEDMMVFGLHRDRQKLYDRINHRVDQMFEQGFLDEVRTILDMGYTLEDPGLNTVGYKEAIAYLNDEISREQMINDMKTQTRRYAKRQLSWFRRWDFINWIDLDQKNKSEARNFIQSQLAAKANKD
ncbi:tRNA (adenosine(37)-N6)-dimethylallyltransferase MiaA [Fodinibius sp.]|uniref:tRNA (adenosine(37)-N6)-dimethylallyltransferase MiaA n=1 Tax=Fodinibius sp. TaxID=1872440 RepID=UPI002ACED112|nr:tRNA (adenosine(37)-N6)-dimethylallyltransferase MiaA [Fodinibius sp.]MDZ7658963.1 tRNA (adenosine(37)-N6)-dimethylallyltransferase MiaA [Fodinibius sp.]